MLLFKGGRASTPFPATTLGAGGSVLAPTCSLARKPSFRRRAGHCLRTNTRQHQAQCRRRFRHPQLWPEGDLVEMLCRVMRVDGKNLMKTPFLPGGPRRETPVSWGMWKASLCFLLSVGPGRTAPGAECHGPVCSPDQEKQDGGPRQTRFMTMTKQSSGKGRHLE